VTLLLFKCAAFRVNEALQEINWCDVTFVVVVVVGAAVRTSELAVQLTVTVRLQILCRT